MILNCIFFLAFGGDGVEEDLLGTNQGITVWSSFALWMVVGRSIEDYRYRRTKRGKRPQERNE